MRETKFRAWINALNCWADEIIISQVGDVWGYIAIKNDNKYFNAVLEQFTGLRDKNGNEIYEGDIVRYWYDLGPAGEYEGVAEVYIGTYEIGPIKEWNYTERRSGGDNWLPEIIGNIHENQELLK